MKKVLYLFIIATGLFMASCAKDKIGGTETEKMAGEWYVKVDAVDASGNVVIEDADLYDLGRIHLDTYNTSANSATEMWVDDIENFWSFKTKVTVDPKTMTFSATDAENSYYNSQMTITNGKVLLGATKTPSGSPADSIVFDITFSDDSPVGFTAYRVSGFRYTGFTADE